MNSSEIYYVLEGSGKLEINGKIHHLKKDDSGSVHQILSNLLKIQDD